jgi:hypothetical protein
VAASHPYGFRIDAITMPMIPVFSQNRNLPEISFFSRGSGANKPDGALEKRQKSQIEKGNETGRGLLMH